MTDPVTIGIGANKWIKDANTKMVTISSAYNVSGYYSLRIAGTSTPYQIPVGKKFVLLYIDTSKTLGTLKKHTVINSTGGTMLINKYASTSNPYTSFCYVEIEAGNYINIYHTGNDECVLVGVETDV
jgi:hypothetical protein